MIVSASLQSGTTCTGVIKSNMPTAPICDSGTGMVTWAIPTVPATTGITGPPAEAIFQVENTPAVNQVGNTVTLLGGSTLQATEPYGLHALGVGGSDHDQFARRYDVPTTKTARDAMNMAKTKNGKTKNDLMEKIVSLVQAARIRVPRVGDLRRTRELLGLRAARR